MGTENQKKVETNTLPREIYETHHMPDLPFFFHYDTILNTTAMMANWHENIEVLYFVKGEADLICNEERTTMSVGDVAVIDSHLLHRVETKTRVEYFCLIVDESFLQENGISLQDKHFVRCVKNSAVLAQYNKIVDLFYSEDIYKEPLLRMETVGLILLLLRHFQLPEAAEYPSKISPAIRQAIHYIHSHSEEKISLDVLSGLVGFSKYHFIREFNKATGYTPLEYLHAVRIERACHLLESGRYSVAEVSSACGFSTPSYFSKLFLRLRGVMPSQWINTANKL